MAGHRVVSVSGLALGVLLTMVGCSLQVRDHAVRQSVQPPPITRIPATLKAVEFVDRRRGIEDGLFDTPVFSSAGQTMTKRVPVEPETVGALEAHAWRRFTGPPARELLLTVRLLEGEASFRAAALSEVASAHVVVEAVLWDAETGAVVSTHDGVGRKEQPSVDVADDEPLALFQRTALLAVDDALGKCAERRTEAPSP